MIEGLTEEQTKFMEAEGRVIVKACPGSGKTYTVAHKLISYIDNWTEYHRGIAVLSFTNVASKEIQEKAQMIHGSLGSLGYPHFVGTVDSFIDEFIVLRYGHLCTAGNVRPRITMSDDWKIPHRWDTECHKRGCADNIEKFYYGIDGNFYKENKLIQCGNGKTGKLPCQQYKKILGEKGIVFQNEAALFAYQLLKEYPQIASAIAERFPILIIDEVQDTSMNQMAVFELLSDAGIKSVFLVGDPDQSIYEWRNANREGFIKKIEDSNWKTINLTGNFRCSQNICNATSFFADSLNGNGSNKAIGIWKDEAEKPVLLLTREDSEEDIVDYFLNRCKKMGIEVSPRNVAVLTRGRIHSDTDITGLWKSLEVELFAKAAYEWKYGSRKRAYKEASRALYNVVFNDDADEYVLAQRIRAYTDEGTWKDCVIDILNEMPDIETGVAEWVKEYSTVFCSVSGKFGYEISKEKDIKEIFKIKRSDKSNPYFKQIPLKTFFEKKSGNQYTRSSIHGVKGESYDAVLLYIKSQQGDTITPKLLMKGDLGREMMRLAYVAMTRARRLLMVAMPDTKGIKKCPRFSEEIWAYEVLRGSI